MEYRLARLSALAARANDPSSSRPSTSPRWRRHRRQGSCSPSPRAAQVELNVQGGHKSKKRKSPCVIMPAFPLSRMILSPRIELRGLGSPSLRLDTSPSTSACDIPLDQGQRTMSEIDLNVALEDSGDDPLVQENMDNLDGQEIGTGDEPLNEQNARKNVLVSDEIRRAIFEALLGRARNGNLKRNETKEVSLQFSVPIRTVQRIWKKGKSNLDQGFVIDVSSGKNRCGRKKKVVDVSKLKDIPLSRRTTIDDVAEQLGVSKSKVQRMKKEGVIKRVSNSIKPYLTDKNKERLRWCLSMLDPMSAPNDPMFQGLFDYVFIDEKWFYITRKSLRYYTVPGEDQPTRTCKNKNYIPKIQILTVQILNLNCERSLVDAAMAQINE